MRYIGARDKKTRIPHSTKKAGLTKVIIALLRCVLIHCLKCKVLCWLLLILYLMFSNYYCAV
jgi:hypothetical protein